MTTDAMAQKLCLITGASSGIGLATARALAERGMRLLLVSRPSGRGAAVAAELAERGAAVEFLPADLSLMAEVRRLAAEVARRYGALDLLINNAGIFVSRYTETAEGLELTFALNHLAYFLLTCELLPLLKAAPEARIINVASEAARMGRIDFDDPMLKGRYNGWRAYAQSKLANIMFTFALARRLEGTPVTANALHPGTVATGFAQNETTTGLSRLVFRLLRPLFRTPEQGAQSIIDLATTPLGAVSGQYVKDSKAVRACRAAYDEGAQERLWQLSERLVGLSPA